MISFKRKLLFYTFLLVFLITTPLVALYATGYKINLSDPDNLGFIQKTGMILIETEPAQAQIFINDKLQKPFFKNLLSKEENLIKTPAKIKNLLPEEYTIRLELSGYWPWTKEVKVESGQITHVRNVKLFKKTLPLLISPARIQKINLSPDKKTAYLPESDLLVDLKNESAEKISSSTSGASVCWSPDSRKLLTGNIVYNLKSKNKDVNLKKLLGEDIINVKWDKDNSNLIYYQHKNSINSFDLSSHSNKTLIDKENYFDYLVKDSQLFYISGDNKTVRLKMYSLNENRTIKEVELPYSEEYELLDEDNGLINLYDRKYRALYLIDLFSFFSPLKEIIANAEHLGWINQDTLLYANDFEIWLLNIASGERRLLTRISDEITAVLATADENYIIYSTNNNINVIELNREDKLFSTELISFQGLSAPMLSDDEKNIYFTAKIGNQEGLYKLMIK